MKRNFVIFGAFALGFVAAAQAQDPETRAVVIEGDETKTVYATNLMIQENAGGLPTFEICNMPSSTTSLDVRLGRLVRDPANENRALVEQGECGYFSAPHINLKASNTKAKSVTASITYMAR